MSIAHFPCERCGGSGVLPDGLVCSTCDGTGKTVPHESAGDAFRDWETRNLGSIVIAFIVAIVGWIWVGKWAFKDDNNKPK